MVDPPEGVTAGRRARSTVDVEGVGFDYEPGEPVLQRHRPARCRRGMNVAIVGETGSGKTTLAKLLCRLADPIEGTHPRRWGRPP